jgi:regulator of sigma E protease
MNSTVGIVVFVVSLVAAIMLHEWGHLASARRFGVRADRFFLGFGPTLWSTRRGETEYGVKALPLGGFVRIKGMTPLDERLRPLPEEVFTVERLTADRRRAAERVGGGADPLEVGSWPETTWERLDEELRDRGTPTSMRERIVRRVRASLAPDADVEQARAVAYEVLVTEVGASRRVGDLSHRLLKGDEGRFFHDRPAWQRAIVLVAGSTMHFVIALAVLLGGFLVLPMGTGEVEPVVSGIEEGSPADEAGLEVGDELAAVDGVASGDFEDLRRRIAASPDEPVTFTVRRGDRTLDLEVTPALVEDPETGEARGVAGFNPTPVTERLGPVEAVQEAVVGDVGFVPLFGATFEAMGRVFGPEGLAAIAQQTAGAEDRDPEGAISLVGAAGLAGQTDAFGPFLLILLIASINIFIGVFNLVPLPPLDGGHLAVLGVERGVNAVRGIRGKPQDFTVDPRAVAAVAVPVIVVLLLLFFALLWLDITSPIEIPR